MSVDSLVAHRRDGIGGLAARPARRLREGRNASEMPQITGKITSRMIDYYYLDYLS
jgi:hypothetical protein